MTSFSERMAQGRELAQTARNRGANTGRVAAGWVTKSVAVNDNWHWIAQQKKEWLRQCAEIRNEYAARCLNPLNDQPENWKF
jgi:hypothetical protein